MTENNAQSAECLSHLNAELGLKLIYEILDVSCDEYYHVLGLFESLEDAKTAIKTNKSPSKPISFHTPDGSDYEKIEIIERPVGWGDERKVVFVIERNMVIDEELDEFVWRTLT